MSEPVQRGPGRPKVADADRRIKRIWFHVSPGELRRLRANAQYRHMSLARYVRTTALEACVIEAPTT